MTDVPPEVPEVSRTREAGDEYVWGFERGDTATPPPVFDQFGQDLMNWDDLDAETKYHWRELERQIRALRQQVKNG